MPSNASKEDVKNSMEKSSETDVEIGAAVETVVLTEKERTKLFLKMDLRVVFILASMFLIQIVDRANIGNAQIEGLSQQLHMNSRQFSNVLTTFAVSYSLFEIPSNMCLRIFKPRFYLPSIVTIWGAVMLASGFSRNYTDLLVCRFFLGVFEAGFFTGCTYTLTLWYPRHYFGFRLAMFFLCSSVAGSFSGLMAFGFSHLSGRDGRLGWAWIFIIEGAITIAIGIVGYFFVQNDPETVNWLSPNEKQWLLQELSKDRGLGGSKAEDEGTVTIKQVIHVFKDWQVYPLSLLALLNTVPVNALNQFLPSIIAGMGYKSLRAQLLTIPIYAVALPFIVGFAYASDKSQKRIPWLISGYLIALAGWTVLAATAPHANGVRLFGCFLVGAGIYSSFAVAAALYSSQFGGKTKRAVGIGSCNTAAALSGILSANAFRAKDAPRFFPGCYTAIGCCVAGIFVLIGLWITYSRINAARAHHLATTTRVYTVEELEAMQDKAPTYVYSL